MVREPSGSSVCFSPKCSKLSRSIFNSSKFSVNSSRTRFSSCSSPVVFKSSTCTLRRSVSLPLKCFTYKWRSVWTKCREHLDNTCCNAKFQSLGASLSPKPGLRSDKHSVDGSYDSIPGRVRSNSSEPAGSEISWLRFIKCSQLFECYCLSEILHSPLQISKAMKTCNRLCRNPL